MKRTFIFLLSIFLTLSSLAQIPYQYIGVNNNRVIARGQFKADSALILPGVSVVNYKAPGMLRYDASDSSVYVYSGFNWIKVGPGAGGSSYSFTYPLQLNTGIVSLDTTKWHSFPFYNTQYRPITWVPTLQEVTTAGNETTDSIVLKRSTTSYISLSNTNIGGPVYGGVINVYRDGGFKLYLKNTEVGVDYNNNRARLIFPVSGIGYDLSFPDTSLGSPSFTIPTIIRVNGSNYTSSNGGLVDLGTITTDISGKLNISDTPAMLAPYLRSNVAAATYQPIGSYLTTATLTDSLPNAVSSIVLNTPNVVFTTPVTFNKTGRAWSGTLSLADQSPFTVFRRASGTGVPSFGTIDSNYFGGLFQSQVRAAQNNSSGIAWTGVDSSFAASMAANGEHNIEEFKVFGSSQTTSQFIVGSNYVFVNGSGSMIGGWDNGVSYVRIGTLTSTSAAPYIHMGHSAGNVLQAYQLSSDWIIMTCRVRIPDLSDGTNSYYVKAGFTTSLNVGTISGGIMFTYDLSGTQTGSSAISNWQTITASSNVRTYNQNAQNTTSVSANTWTKLQIVATSSVAYFYINGTLVATHTSNLPTSQIIVPYFDIRKTAGTTARSLDIDYTTIDIKYSTPR